MAITDKLRDLDQRVLPGTRDAEESAEDYLRRVASGKVISPAQLGDVQAALREMFGMADDAAAEPLPDQAEGERDDAPKDESDSSEGDDAGAGSEQAGDQEPEGAPDQAEGER